MAIGEGLHYYDRAGTPIDLMTWGRLSEDMEYKRLARTTIISATDQFDVSTVWLGLDHSFDHGPILIFETMIFGAALDDLNPCYRYSTEADAIAGHSELVTVVASTMDDPVIMDVSETERRTEWSDPREDFQGMVRFAVCPQCSAEYPNFHSPVGSLETACDRCGWTSEKEDRKAT